MFSRFFIDRPIFASVLSIVITLAGGIALFHLPLAMYPTIAPPTVSVTCQYPGASANVVAEAVAAPIEERVNGVENMLYMAGQCTDDGSYNLTVTFKQGVDLNMAQVLVQNRVNLAMPSLPTVIKQTGVTIRKRSPDMLLSVTINSPGSQYDQLYLSNYALMHIREELVRLPGVSDVSLMGERDYCMRIWVDPDRLAARGLTADDVAAAVTEQNRQVACGHLGQEPVPAGQGSEFTLTTLGRLIKPEQFENIVLRADADGRVLRLKDVAEIKLGAQNVAVQCRMDKKPSVSLAVFQLPGANALEVADEIHAKLRELSKSFPRGVIYGVQYDTTPYTRESINEVFKALRDSILLVAFVVLLFLQNWRSALIPLLAVPVALIGTFAVMYVSQFSLNNLTLFGLVLTIGIVVDDAIVVVEAVEHHIEEGLAPRDATIAAMSQVSGPVVAVGLVLSAVFVPCAFISGVTGQFFRQFALTIAASTIISTFNSLTLSPALSAILLRSHDKETHEPLPRVAFAALAGWLCYRLSASRLDAWFGPALAGVPETTRAWIIAVLPWIAAVAAAAPTWFLGKWFNAALLWVFRWFELGFKGSVSLYIRAVGRLLHRSGFVLAVYGLLLLCTGFGFWYIPKGFIPTQDMGILMVNVQLPDAASLERTNRVMKRLEDIALAEKGVLHVGSVAGTSVLLSANGSNLGFMFLILDDFDKRRSPALYSEVIRMKLQKKFSQEIPDAVVTAFPMAPIRGVGRAGGFKLMVEDVENPDPAELERQSENMVAKANAIRSPKGVPQIVGLTNVFRANAPQLYADVNRVQCMQMDIPISAVFNALQIYLGSLYVNDFNLFGRTWQVVIQADARFRNQYEKAMQLKVRNTKGDMVPLGSLIKIRQANGPLILTRYNMRLASGLQGNAGPGLSSRGAIDLMEDLARKELPTSKYHIEWTELAFLELQAGNTAMKVFGFAVLMVFLVLAAQYESWSLPLAVILVVPMCLSSAIAGVLVTGTDINIFTQIGFVVLVGLASKNAILIVEFAKRQREAGASPHDAALAACRLRLRPIVMTSFAFILGSLSLVLATGAGAEMRRTLGTAVFSGMLGVTLFGVFLTPVFFIVVDRFSGLGGLQSARARRIGHILLFIITLGLSWIVSQLRHRK